VIRAGNLQGRSTDGVFQANFASNNFAGQLRAYALLGKISWERMGAENELSPVDSTAQAILRLAEAPRASCLFHAFSPHRVFYADIVQALSACGLAVAPCEEAEFEAAFAKAGEDPAKVTQIAPLIVYNRAGGDRLADLGASCAFTVEALLRSGFRWPLPDAAYLRAAVAHAVGAA